MIGAVLTDLIVTVGLFVLCMWLGMVIHELGHFAVMRAFGYKVTEISFGAKRSPMLGVPIGSTTIYLSPYVWQGATVFHIEQSSVQVRILAAIAVAGSFANVLAVIAVFSFRGLQDFASLADLSELRKLSIFFSAFVVMNLAYGIGELLPFSGDGLILLKLGQGKYGEVEELLNRSNTDGPKAPST